MWLTAGGAKSCPNLSGLRPAVLAKIHTFEIIYESSETLARTQCYQVS
jgi:hypothetical protein